MRQATRSIFGALALCLAAFHAPATAQTFPERGRSAVVDAAGVIPDEREAGLETQILAWNRSTGHQLVVATVPGLEGYEVQDYGYRLLRHWGLGRAGIDDGVILLLAPNEREVRIEVGYGLEPVLTDAVSSRIIHQTIRPALRAGDVAGALANGAERIMQVAATVDGEAAQPPPAAERGFPWVKYLLIAVGLGLLLVFLWPVFETWYFVWPFYRLMPERAERARQRHDARLAKNEESFRSRNDLIRAKSGPVTKRRGRGDPAADAAPVQSDALEQLRERAERDQDLGGRDSYSDSSSQDSGFDSGGGSAGGGGADSNY